MTRSRIITITLLVMTVILIIAIFTVGFILSRPAEETTTVAPRKTKAQNQTYSRYIAFVRLPTQEDVPTPTPTEIILAKEVSPSPTISPTMAATVALSSNLPETGNVSSALFIFAAAGMMIFFSFLF